MNSTPTVFDSAKVADVARQLAETEKRVVSLRKEKYDADQALNRAECELSNLRTEFTRVSAPHLDRPTFDALKPDTRRAVPA